MKGVGGEEGKVSSKVELRLPSLLLPSLFRKPSSLSNVFGSSVIYYSVLSSIILDTGRILSRTKALCSDLYPLPRFVNLPSRAGFSLCHHHHRLV